MRRSLVIGNWKMNGNLSQAKQLLRQLQQASLNASVDVAVCPSLVYISSAINALTETTIALGAQNVAAESDGAYTGEVSAAMLADIACRFVLVGHSERRARYNETSALTLEKVQQCLQHNLVPVLCLGETLEERDRGETFAVIEQQLSTVLNSLSEQQAEQLVLAYEPVWAIGTGLTASPDQAQDVHAHLRAQLAAKSEQAAAKVRILYGGSVKANNAVQLFAQQDIDGGLIGGASLDADDFASIVNSAG